MSELNHILIHAVVAMSRFFFYIVKRVLKCFSCFSANKCVANAKSLHTVYKHIIVMRKGGNHAVEYCQWYGV